MAGKPVAAGDPRAFRLPDLRSAGATAAGKLPTSEYIRGSLYGLTAVSIWASWIVAVRLGIKISLQPWDIVAIRFGVAGLILLPYLLKKGLAIDRLGWAGLAAIMLGGGGPMVMVSYGGLLFAPAAHAASLYTALIPICCDPSHYRTWRGLHRC
jgi:hypothetical protein